MKHTLKKSLAIILAAATLLCCAPLSVFLGIELPDVTNLFSNKSEAVEVIEVTPNESEIVSGRDGNLSWSLNKTSGNLTITGKGRMSDYSWVDMANWRNDGYAEEIKNVVIYDGVESIGTWAFYGCKNLEFVTIPNSVITINEEAFEKCTALTDIYYCGTEEEWNKISIDPDNAPLYSAIIHSDYVPEEGETPNPLYYTATWNANGGMWSDGDIRKVVTTAASSNITVPSDPEKDGYEFIGWFPAIPETMPDCDMTFTAIWQEAETAPSAEDIAKQNFVDEHVKFAKSSNFVNFKDKNLANQFSEIIRDDRDYHINNFLALNFFTNYYDVVVAQVISSEEMHNAFVDIMNAYLANNVRSVYTDIFDSINTIDGSTGLDEFDFFDMFMSKDLSAYKNTPIYDSVLHVFGKNRDELVTKIFKGTDYVNRGLTLASSAMDIVEGITDCVYYKSALDAYRQTNVYFKEVLKMVADSDIDSGLKKAISNFADASNEEDYLEYADTLFTKWKSVSVRKGLKISCDLFLGKLLAGTAKVILNIPLKGGATLASKSLTITTQSGGTVVATAAQIASGVVAGVTLGMTVSSVLVNSDDFSYNAAACAHMGDFANAVWPVLTKLEQQLTTNPTFENALLFENAFMLYKEIQIWSVKNMISIAESRNNSVLFWLLKKKEDVSAFVATETRFRNLNCHTSDFSELLAGEYKRKEATGYKVNMTACPVDVYIYDSLGNLVARVINDYAEVFDNRISVHVIDSVKYFGLPNDEEYSIKIFATDEGEMDYFVFEFNENAVMTRDVSTENIPLAEGKIFEGKIDKITDTAVENYNLIISGTGEVIEAEKDTDCVHATGISISQTVAEMKVGEKISLSASVIPSNSTDNIAWHSSDESVVKVSEYGIVEAVGEGEAVIKIIANNSVYVECEITVSEHEHTYISSITTPATCRTAGVLTYICTECGDSYIETIPATGHTAGTWEKVLEPTTETEGKKIKKCTACGVTLEEAAIAKLPKEPVKDNAVVKNPSITSISYGDSIILHVDESKIPAGGRVEWTASNGNFSYKADGATCTISPEKSGDTTFTATIYDADDNAVSTDEQTMTSKAGFFDKIIAFFKKLFGLTKTIPQAFKGIF